MPETTNSKFGLHAIIEKDLQTPVRVIQTLGLLAETAMGYVVLLQITEDIGKALNLGPKNLHK